MTRLTSLLAVLASSLPLSHAASLQKLNVTLEHNPSNVGFYIYVPDQTAPSPPILVNPHWCHGDAPSAFAGSKLASLASQYGFIVQIYPDSPNLSDKCWDVSSRATLSHDGGEDSRGIVSMVSRALGEYGGDAARVFATGVSSGAMMANVLVGAYPDVFAAGSAFAGVPFGCYGADIPANTSDVAYWNSNCAEGRVQHSAAEWASIVRAAYPGYGSGWRPRMQVFHGTVDEVLSYANLGEEVKELDGRVWLEPDPYGHGPGHPPGKLDQVCIRGRGLVRGLQCVERAAQYSCAGRCRRGLVRSAVCRQ